MVRCGGSAAEDLSARGSTGAARVRLRAACAGQRQHRAGPPPRPKGPLGALVDTPGPSGAGDA